MNNQITLFSKSFKKLTFFLLVCFFTSQAFANSKTAKVEKTNSIQRQTIKGRVVDNNGVPLAGASIIEKGTTNGTQTDFDGTYSITVSNKAVLVFSYIGFITKEVIVSSNNEINVTLEEDISSLKEVVVVGYGTQERINVTGSVATLKVDDVVTTPAANVKSLLIGQIPGVITNQNPGLPGQDNVDLSIRGFGNPLVIVDGLESSLDRIDPNDIETISILKDAAAAIYGVRGGDGVILVTTKRGKAGVMQFDYHGYTAIQKPVKFLEPADAAGYIQAKRNGIFNADFNPNSPNAAIDYGPEWSQDRLAQYQSGELQSYNWVDALLKNGGSRLSAHNFSASGGSEKVRHYTSLGVLTQDGIFKGDYNYKKLTLTNNLDVNFTDDVSLSLNSSYIDETRDYAASGADKIWEDLRTAQPFFLPVLPDPDRAAYSGFGQRSPIARTQKKFGGYNFTTIESLAAALELKYNLPFVEGLTVGAKANVKKRIQTNRNLTKTYTVYEYLKDTDTYRDVQTINPVPSFNKRVIVDKDDDPTSRFLSRFYLEYNKTIGKHKIGGLAFIEKEDNEVDKFAIESINLLSDDVPKIEVGDNANTQVTGFAVPFEYSRISVAGRFNYAYDNKYLLEATWRADASSKVAPGVRWGYFPSVSLGWNMAKENFLKDSAIDELKLRLSYSETGKDNNIPDLAFDYLTGFRETGSVYYLDGQPVANIITEGLVNPNLTWVQVNLYNAGLDFRLYKGKFYGNLDVFYRIRQGMLAESIRQLPTTFGANLPKININSRNDHGFDLALGYKGSIGKLKVNLNGNFTFARERHQDFQQDIDFNDPNQVRIDLKSGRYENRTFGYVTDGLINTQGELEDYVASTTFETLDGTPKVGDIKYVDVTGPEGVPDGVINRYDLREIGYGEKPDINFGFNSKFTYKNVSLSLLFQGASMFNVRAQGGLFRSPFDSEMSLLTLHQKYSWTQDPNNPGVGNNPNAQLPAYDENGGRIWNNSNDNFSDFWLRDGTFVRLKTATLSYSLDKKVLDKIGLRNLNFYVTGDNLFTLTRLGIFNDVIDPEQSYNNSGYSLPLLRSYTFGVQIGL